MELQQENDDLNRKVKQCEADKEVKSNNCCTRLHNYSILAYIETVSRAGN